MTDHQLAKYRQETQKELECTLQSVHNQARNIGISDALAFDVSDAAYALQDRAVAEQEELLRLAKRKHQFMASLRSYQKLVKAVAERTEGWIDCLECDDGWEWVSTDYSNDGGYHQECTYCKGKQWMTPEEHGYLTKLLGSTETPALTSPTDA